MDQVRRKRLATSAGSVSRRRPARGAGPGRRIDNAVAEQSAVALGWVEYVQHRFRQQASRFEQTSDDAADGSPAFVGEAM